MGNIGDWGNSSGERQIIFVLIIIIVFFLLREINTWYWKIDKIVDKLDDISKTLHRLEENNINMNLEKPISQTFFESSKENKLNENEMCKNMNKPMGEDIIVDDWAEDKPKKSIFKKISEILNAKLF